MEQSRNTKQKQMILEILEKSRLPMSINEIYKQIVVELPNIAKSTIYRNIDNLIKQNHIDKYYLKDNELYYQIKGSTLGHKHYFICDGCNKMFDLPICPIHEIENHMVDAGFVVNEHYVQLNGLCKDCAMK